MWLNRRAELWGKMRDWLKTAHIPADRALKSDLIGVQSKPTSSGVIQLESKKDLKARGLASPDAADALAVTFAYPVAHRTARQESANRVNMQSSRPSSGWMGACIVKKL